MDSESSGLRRSGRVASRPVPMKRFIDVSDDDDDLDAYFEPRRAPSKTAQRKPREPKPEREREKERERGKEKDKVERPAKIPAVDSGAAAPAKAGMRSLFPLDAFIPTEQEYQEWDTIERFAEEYRKAEVNVFEREAELKRTLESGAALEDEIEADPDYLVPPHCIPIRADVTQYDEGFKKLAQAVQFDVIMMDPPWQLASATPTRGVALGYLQLDDDKIAKLPVQSLQKNGFIFIWVINSRYSWTLKQMKAWGYEFVTDISWVKRTVNRRLAKGHGFYLQHAKETCLVGRKGEDPPGTQRGLLDNTDVIFSERRGQSQKPEEIYELIERLVPNGKYLEIFARKNNLHDHWVSIGLEL